MAYQQSQESQEMSSSSGAGPDMANGMNASGTSGTLDSGQGAHTMLLRIQRGAVAMGADGELGSVQQIVVDRETGELRALVVRQTNTASGETHELEIPVSHIVQASGSQVQLDIGQADLRAHPELARPYNPDEYTPVYQGTVAQEEQAQRVAVSTEHPVVTEVERDAAAVIMPDTQAQTAPVGGAMSQPAQPAGVSGSRGVDMPITPAMPVAETQPFQQPATGQVAGTTAAPLDGPTITASTSSLPEYGIDSTLPQRPGAEAIGASATTPANDIPPMAIPTPENAAVTPPQADAPEPMEQMDAMPDLSATDTAATDFTPTQPAQLDELQPVMLGGATPPIPPTRQLPEPSPRSRFAPSPVVVLLLGGVGLLITAVWLTSRIERAERRVEHAVKRNVGNTRARAQLKKKAQFNVRKAQRQGMDATQRVMNMSQQMAQQALDSSKQTTQQLSRSAFATATAWRDAFSRQAPVMASALAESSQSAASRARVKAAQFGAQAKDMARDNMSRMPQRMGSLRRPAGGAWSQARMALRFVPARARWFRRGFQAGTRVGAVGGATAAQVNAWRKNAPWANRSRTPTATTGNSVSQPQPLVVKTTIRPRRIMLFRRQADVNP